MMANQLATTNAAPLNTAEFSAMIKMVAGQKGEMLAIVPGDKEAPIAARAAALVMSNLMGLGAKGYQVYQVQGRWVVEPTYKSMITLAQRISKFRVVYESANVADYLPDEQLKGNPHAMAVICKIFRDDEMGNILRLRREALQAGYTVDDLDAIGLAVAPAAEAVGIYYSKKMRQYKDGKWGSDTLPNTWTPEDQAKKRALKKALRLAFGEMAVPPAIAVENNPENPTITVTDGQLAFPTPSQYPPDVTMKVMLEWGERWQYLDEEQREYLFGREMQTRANDVRLTAMTTEEIQHEAAIARDQLGGKRKKRLAPPPATPTDDDIKDFEEEFRQQTQKNVGIIDDFAIWFRDKAKEEKAAVVDTAKRGAIRGHLEDLASGDRQRIIDFLTTITGREIKTSSDLKPSEWAALYAWLRPKKNEDTGKWYVSNDKAQGTFTRITDDIAMHRGQLAIPQLA